MNILNILLFILFQKTIYFIEFFIYLSICFIKVTLEFFSFLFNDIFP